MRSEDMRKLQREYELLRDRALEEAGARRNAAYKACPELEALHHQRRMLNHQLGFDLLKSPSREAELHSELSAKLKALAEREHKLLSNFAIDPYSFEPQYRCSRCNDTGFVGGAPCACFRQRALELEYELLELADASQSFEAFNLSIFPEKAKEGFDQRAYMADIKMRCIEYADDFPRTEKPNMLFIGAPGLGKSFMLNAIARHVVENGHSALKLSAYKFVMAILESIHSGGTVQTRPFIESDLLLIDDLGSEPDIKNITVEYVYSIINERKSLRKPIIIATNLTTMQLAKRYGARVVSRIIDTSSTQIFNLKGDDLRLKG